jgi:hypothetical protein
MQPARKRCAQPVGQPLAARLIRGAAAAGDGGREVGGAALCRAVLRLAALCRAALHRAALCCNHRPTKPTPQPRRAAAARPKVSGQGDGASVAATAARAVRGNAAFGSGPLGNLRVSHGGNSGGWGAGGAAVAGRCGANRQSSTNVMQARRDGFTAHGTGQRVHGTKQLWNHSLDSFCSLGSFITSSQNPNRQSSTNVACGWRRVSLCSLDSLAKSIAATAASAVLIPFPALARPSHPSIRRGRGSPCSLNAFITSIHKHTNTYRPAPAACRRVRAVAWER